LPRPPPDELPVVRGQMPPLPWWDMGSLSILGVDRHSLLRVARTRYICDILI